jgi:hypothetical protein
MHPPDHHPPSAMIYASLTGESVENLAFSLWIKL